MMSCLKSKKMSYSECVFSNGELNNKLGESINRCNLYYFLKIISII